MKHIGVVIKEARKKRGMTQQSLADNTGVTKAYISMLETGVKENVSKKVLSGICKALEVPVEVLSFMQLDLESVPEKKKEMFKVLKPAVNNLIKEFFFSKPKVK